MTYLLYDGHIDLLTLLVILLYFFTSLLSMLNSSQTVLVSLNFRNTSCQLDDTFKECEKALTLESFLEGDPYACYFL